MRDEREAKLAIDTYASTVRKICFVYLKNRADVEDMFQEVFTKYVLYERNFASPEHEKAWLIRVTINACKDVLKSMFRKETYLIEDLVEEPGAIENANRDVLDVVMRLPKNYRIVIYLHYYEGYSAHEIAAILQKNENTIYTWLSRARGQLKEVLGGE
jgi:RNA polymerase sigma-70 factor (ECF subfamily)